MGGPAPFYTLQDLNAAQDPNVQPPYAQAQPSIARAAGIGQENLAAGIPDAPSAPPGGPPPGPPQGPQMPTMGQLHDDSTPDPAAFHARQQQYIQQAMRLISPMMTPKYLQPPPVSTIANIMSFGRAGNDAANYANHWNAVADQKNNALRLKAMEMAQQMMNADATQEMAKAHLDLSRANFGLSSARFTLEALRAAAEDNSRKLTDALNEYRLRAFPYHEHVGGAPADLGTNAGIGDAINNTRLPPGWQPGQAPVETPGASEAPDLTAPQSGPRPGEDLKDYADRRKEEIAAGVKTAQAKQQADQETKDQADAVNRQIGPDLDEAIKRVLPNTSKDFGVVARARAAANASSLNPMDSGFQNRLAKGDPDAARIQAAVNAALPFIRAVAGGTKGFRLTKSEIALLTEDNLQRLSQGRMGQQQALVMLKTLRGAVARATGTGAGPTTTTTPGSSTTSTTQPDRRALAERLASEVNAGRLTREQAIEQLRAGQP